MYTKLIHWICVALLLTAGGIVQAAVFSDNFETPHDYVADGVAGTSWDGFVGLGARETVDALDASISRPGQLYLESAGAFYHEPWDPLGPFLYKMVEGDFVATVQVTDYAGTEAVPVYHNNCGLMARANLDDAGTGEDWVSLDYFPIWGCGNFVRSADDNARSENGHNGQQFNLDPWLQIERQGNTFYFRTSPDGTSWTELGASPLTRDDLADVPLQVGVYQATYSADSGYAAFDTFMVEGPLVVPGLKSYGPEPGDNATDVPRDTQLSWRPAETAIAHDLYIGTVLDGVINADRGNPLSAVLSQGQLDTTYEPDSLVYGETYYWRVDEVQADGAGIEPGDVWTFTVEPYAYPITDVTATASSANNTDMGPEKTVDGSGLDAYGQHSTDGKTMWLSSKTGPQPTWIRYAFDQPYRLHQMWVWNSNQDLESMFGLGARNVSIEYSLDDEHWVPLGDFEFDRAPGLDTYVTDTKIDFGGVLAQYVKLTIHTNWEEIFTQYGLSEVRFYSVPVTAREPDPLPETTAVDPQVTLSWRPGREAATHQVYLDPDRQAVIDGTAPMVTVPEPTYDVAVDLASQYFWKVVEVNDVEDPSAWEGEVWSFSTVEYLVVDDFEGYANLSPDRVFQTWIDGAGFSPDDWFPNGNAGNGSGALVGYDPLAGDIMETGNVHGGRQSMPLDYDNTIAPRYSEAERTFAVPQDWSKHGITTLVVHFCGDVENAPAPVYVKINGQKLLYNNGAAVTAVPVWKQWNIDLAGFGVGIASVKTLAIGVGDGASGGVGRIFVDDLRLYATPPPMVSPVDPGTSDIVLLYAMENNVQDTSGQGRHGMASGEPAYDQGPSGFGRAMSLDGLNDYVDVPVAPLLSSLNSLTITVRVSLLDPTRYWQRVFDFGTDATNYMFLSPNNGTTQGVRFAIRTPTVGEQVVTAPTPLADGWHHLAIVIDGATGTMQLYQDGLLADNGTTTLLPPDLGETSQNWLGRSQFTADPYYTGLLDDFRIYDRPLSEAEVRYLAGDR